MSAADVVVSVWTNKQKKIYLKTKSCTKCVRLQSHVRTSGNPPLQHVSYVGHCHSSFLKKWLCKMAANWEQIFWLELLDAVFSCFKVRKQTNCGWVKYSSLICVDKKPVCYSVWRPILVIMNKLEKPSCRNEAMSSCATLWLNNPSPRCLRSFPGTTQSTNVSAATAVPATALHPNE